MNDKFQENLDKAAAFQKMWAESLTKSVQAAWTSSAGGNTAPPEILKQMRAGIFEALAQSWDQFMRSPEFLDVMRQWMEQAVSFRKMTNDFIAKARKEAQSPSTEDVENILLAVRHMEKRLLDRMDELAARIDSRPDGKATAQEANGRQGPRARVPRASRQSVARAGKGTAK